MLEDRLLWCKRHHKRYIRSRAAVEHNEVRARVFIRVQLM